MIDKGQMEEEEKSQKYTLSRSWDGTDLPILFGPGQGSLALVQEDEMGRSRGELLSKGSLHLRRKNEELSQAFSVILHALGWEGIRSNMALWGI